jgi:flagellar motor switch protein FliN/FliY
MSDSEAEGHLGQEDINSALAAAGLEAGAEGPAPGTESGEPPAPGTDVKSDGGPPAGEKSAPSDPLPAEAADTTTPAPEDDSAPSATSGAGGRSFELPELRAEPAGLAGQLQAIDLLRDVELNVKIELGRSRMLVDDVLRLGEGSVVELDKLAGDPVDVLVNDRLVARGEVLVLNDNFCVRINDIVSKDIGQEDLT